MRNGSTFGSSIAVRALGLAAFALALGPAARAQAGGPLEVTIAVPPPFRTDLAAHVSFGGSSCLGGGTGYAACSGAFPSWDTLLGFEAGVLTRPFRFVSFGLDGGLTALKAHQVSANRWWDFTLGPVVRAYLPMRVGERLYVEPSLGLQGGLVVGQYRQDKTGQDESVGYRHEHYGAFAAAIVGLDFFPLPRVGVGLDVRVLRTFYTNVCFETGGDTICRGTRQGELAVSNLHQANGQPIDFLGDMGKASYPWKMFWGVHALYYF